MDTVWLLHLNPFLWEGVVFLLFGVVCAAAVDALFGFPRRLLEAVG